MIIIDDDNDDKFNGNNFPDCTSHDPFKAMDAITAWPEVTKKGFLTEEYE